MDRGVVFKIVARYLEAFSAFPLAPYLCFVLGFHLLDNRLVTHLQRNERTTEATCWAVRKMLVWTWTHSGCLVLRLEEGVGVSQFVVLTIIIIITRECDKLKIREWASRVYNFGHITWYYQTDLLRASISLSSSSILWKRRGRKIVYERKMLKLRQVRASPTYMYIHACR